MAGDSQARWVRAVLAAVVVLLLLAHVAVLWHQINDDAFITFRYSWFLASGRGPYFNAGEHVEGYTNFSLMVLMAGLIAWLGDEPAFVLAAAKAVNVGGALVAAFAAAALCRRWLRKLAFEPAWTCEAAAWAAGAITATNFALVVNTTTGLETSLFSGLVALGCLLVQKARDERRWCGGGAVFALAALTRPEGVFIFGAAAAGRLLAGEWRPGPLRRFLLMDAGIVAAIAAGHLALRIALYDGDVVPNTYFAKAGGMIAAVSSAGYVWQFIHGHLGGVAAAAVLLPLLGRPGSTLRGDVAPTLLVLAAAVAGIFHTGPDWMLGSRMLAPYAPLCAALMVCGLANVLARAWASKPTAAARTAALSAVAACLALYAWQLAPAELLLHDTRTRARGYIRGHVALSDWLRGRAAPGQTVALMDIGIVGYRNPELRVLDVTGLTDRFIARSPGGFLDKRFDPAYVFDRRPEFVVLALQGTTPLAQLGDAAAFAGTLRSWTALEDRLVTDPRFAAQYVRVRPAEPAAGPLDRLACVIGAERVFEHDYPDGLPYLLAVYVRHDE